MLYNLIPSPKMTKGHNMSPKFYRNRGFQHRRIAFAIKVLVVLWLIPMAGFFLTGKTWMHLLGAVTGYVALALPSLVFAAYFDAQAEDNFLKAAAAKNQALLGVVHPKE